ncbi:MAG: LysM peptidoglycan-binding domain-containing protein [Chitinophagales bacterium]
MVHIIKKGDTLYSLATTYNVSVEKIIHINALKNNILKLGQHLFVPDYRAMVAEQKPETFNQITYIVRTGDTLYKVASSFGVSVNDLKQLNNLTSNSLYVGQQLVIGKISQPSTPPSNNSTTNTTTTSPSSGTTASNFTFYKVQSGDTLWKIAQKFGVSVDSIKNTNNLSSNSLALGQQIKIPTSATSNTTNSGSSNVSKQKYKVKSGDTLSAIAWIFETTVDAIKKSNNLSSNNLSIGQILIIPSKNNAIIVEEEPKDTKNTATNETNSSNNSSSQVYVVQGGDTMWRIAKKFNVAVNDIVKWNNLTSNVLALGQVLVIKSSTSVSNTDSSSGHSNSTSSADSVKTAVAKALDFRYTLQISNSVGMNGQNISKDVRKVQDHLYRLGFLTKAVYESEKAALNSSAKVSLWKLSKTIQALKSFQLTAMGIEYMNGIVKPNSGILMFLNTAIAMPSQHELNKIRNKRSEFKISVTNGYSQLGNSLTAAVGNTNWGNQAADIKKVQGQLLNLGYLSASHTETPKTATVVASSLPQTIRAIKRFQSQQVKYWVGKPLANATSFLEGVVNRDESDLTFRILRAYTKYDLSFRNPLKNSLTQTAKFTNFIKSWHTIDWEGIGYQGEVLPDSLGLWVYKQLGLNEVQAKALKYVSEHEGRFDAINSYDKAIFSYGFIQFAGGTGGFGPMMAFMKHAYPDTFKARFQDYGIDVEYSITKGQIKKAHLVIIEPMQSKILRLTEAEKYLRSDKLLNAVFLKAAYDTKVQRSQIESAYRKYVVPALNISADFSVPVIKVLASNKKTLIKKYIGTAASDYKGTWEYGHFKGKGQIVEEYIGFWNEPLTNIIRSEKGITVLIDLTVNQWVNNTRNYFVNAILQVAADDKLDTKAKILNISEWRVLSQIVKNGDALAKQRTQNILENGDLSSGK